MTDFRKNELLTCVWLFVACTVISVIVFFVFFALPPVALAAPAAIWTPWGFQFLRFITQTTIPATLQVKSSAINFFFVLALEFATPIMDVGDFIIIRIIGIAVFFTCLCGIDNFLVSFFETIFTTF